MDEEFFYTKEERDYLRELYAPYTDMLDDFICSSVASVVNDPEVTEHLEIMKKEFGE